MKYSNPIIELLGKFKPVIGEDYDLYINHVYRVFLNCRMMDSTEDNAEKYAIATVFHDIGIWTNYTFDYLDPSIEQANLYLASIAKEQWMEEISFMIYWHHKTTTYQGKYEGIVENFRKADWIDVSFWLLNFGLEKQNIMKSRGEFPTLGFHRFLIKKIFENLLNIRSNHSLCLKNS